MSNSGASLKENIMSDAQVNNIRSSALAWVTEKTRRKIIQFLQAVKFELITDGKCWLRGGGKITVRMLIQFDQCNYNGQPQVIKVYSSNNAFYDPKAITEQLADILDEYLLSQKHIARIDFNGRTREKIKESWQTQAVEWLVADIRNDPDLFESLHFRTEDGRKLIIKIPAMHNLIELEMQFEQGICYFAPFLGKVETELSTLFYNIDNMVIFDHAQLASQKRKIIPLIVEAIRDNKFSYPYPDHAIKSVLGMRKDIAHYAEELGVTPLALAGVLADEYEDDLAPKVKQVFADLEEILLLAVARNYNSIDNTISFGLTLISEFIKKGNIYWTLADILWTMLPKQAKKALIKFAVEAILAWPKSVLTDLAETHDQLSEGSIKVQLNLEAELEALKKDIVQCGKDMKGYTIKEGLVDLITIGSALWYGGGQESIKNRATKIKTHLDHANLPMDQREYVCKWERLYSYFKA